MGMADSAKIGKMRAGTVGLCGRTLFSTFVTLSYGQIFLKFQILSQLLPLKLFIYNAFIFEASPPPPR